MLSGTNFASFFEKQLVKNCDVAIKELALEGSTFVFKTLLTGLNFSSFEMNRDNGVVPEGVPHDEALIEIKDWDNLSATTKTKLQTIGKMLYVFFTVENEETETTTNGGGDGSFVAYKYGHIDMCIRDCHIAFNGSKATLKLVGAYESPTYLQHGTSSYRGTDGNPKTAPYGVSRAEAIQQLRLTYGYSMVYQSERLFVGGSFVYFPINDYVSKIGLNKKNITGDIEYYPADDNKDTIEAIGLTTTGSEKTFTDSDSSALARRGIAHPKQQYIFTSAEYLYSGTIYNSCDFIVDNFTASTELITNFLTTPTYFRLNCYDAEYASPSSNDVDIVYCNYLVVGTDDTQIAFVQTTLRDYYSNKTYYEFDCRIDPRIEPCDNLYVDGIGIIKVESMSLSFNGGFKGHIKGRRVGDMLLNPVVVSNLSYDDEDFYFVLRNQNNVKVLCRFQMYDGSTIDITLNANTTSSYNSSVIPELMDSFVLAYNGELPKDVYIETYNYEILNLKAVDTLLLEKSLLAPELVDIELIDDENWHFEIRNNNDVAVDVYVYYSGGLIQRTIQAHDTSVFNHSNCPYLDTSVYSYLQLDLSDEVYAQFEASGSASIATTILEANG